MKYRIEVQQVFAAHGYDRGGEWVALGDKPRGKAAAIALMETLQAASGLQPPYRVVSVDALGDRVEVARIESPHKPVPVYAVEVTDAQGEKRQEFDSLPLAMQTYNDCVNGAENDPRKGYTRRVALVGLASGETHYKWEYQAPQVAPMPVTAEFIQNDKIQVTANGHVFTFRVEFEQDDTCREPWEDSEGHGPVSDWTHRDKLPGELVLNTDRTAKRFYDYAEACRIALRDRWDALPYNDGSQTKRQQAAKAALSNFNYLREWCQDEWRYVIVTVTLLDAEGEETNVREILGGVEDRGAYHRTTALELAQGLASGYGTTWGAVAKETFDYLQTEGASHAN